MSKEKPPIGSAEEMRYFIKIIDKAQEKVRAEIADGEKEETALPKNEKDIKLSKMALSLAWITAIGTLLSGVGEIISAFRD